MANFYCQNIAQMNFVISNFYDYNPLKKIDFYNTFFYFSY